MRTRNLRLIGILITTLTVALVTSNVLGQSSDPMEMARKYQHPPTQMQQHDNDWQTQQNLQNQNYELQRQTREMQKQNRIMQQQYQEQKNQQAYDQIMQNNSAITSNVERYANYPDVLDAIIELQEAKMAYLNTMQTRMPAGTGAAAFEGIADAIRSKKARKRVTKAEKALAKAIQRAESDMRETGP